MLNLVKKMKKKIKKVVASAGNRTRINCLEGSYAHHYTTDALLSRWRKYNYIFLGRGKN